ncbi:MAG: glycosyltransferase family 2 protein [Ignavibacteria bacterium]|nr:glycosyltransferase family 2 protein [Ignavibacteria bacterium]
MVLSVIIANWNTKELIKGCIESVLQNSGFKNSEYEIIVIDNASNDGSKEYLFSLEGKIKLIENPENLGYAKACNQGFAVSTGKYILLLGSDTVMLNDTLPECIKYLDKNPDAGAAACKLLNPDGTVQNSLKKFPKLSNAFFTYLSLDKFNKEYDMSEFKYDKVTEAEQAAATFLMLRRSLLEKIGLFDEDYRILYNDVELAGRINASGSKIIFLDYVSIIHYGSHSTKNADFALRKIMYGDIYRYYRKHFGFKAVFLYPILAFRLLVVSTIKS